VGSGFNFHNGQNIFGRTSDFTQLATGDNRPLINDTIILNGNNNVYNIRVDGHTIEQLETGGATQPFQVGLLTAPTSNGIVNVYDSAINQTSSTGSGISVANNSNVDSLNIYNSNITSSLLNFPGGIGTGVGNLRTSELNLFNSTITNFVTDTSNNFSLSFGVVNNEAGLINITNTSINASMTHGGLVAGVLSNSTLGGGLGTITMTGSNIAVNGSDVSQMGGIFNQANNGEGNSANIDISQSTISLISDTGGSGIFTTGNGTISVNSSSINNASDNGTIAGISVAGSTSTVNYQNMTISINPSGSATGTPTENSGGTLNDNGGNQCFENGVSVPCQ
jgi:hypothetical protein